MLYRDHSSVGVSHCGRTYRRSGNADNQGNLLIGVQQRPADRIMNAARIDVARVSGTQVRSSTGLEFSLLSL